MLRLSRLLAASAESARIVDKDKDDDDDDDGGGAFGGDPEERSFLRFLAFPGRTRLHPCLELAATSSDRRC